MLNGEKKTLIENNYIAAMFHHIFYEILNTITEIQLSFIDR